MDNQNINKQTSNPNTNTKWNAQTILDSLSSRINEINIPHNALSNQSIGRHRLVDVLFDTHDYSKFNKDWLDSLTQSIENDKTAINLKNEIKDLSNKIYSLNQEIEAHQDGSQKKDHLIDNLKSTITELETKIIKLNLQTDYYYIYSQVCEDAKNRAEQDLEFANYICTKRKCLAYILSIDIRRSTELMLKSKSPQHYEQFINTFFSGLKRIIINNYGIFDKFTGDGSLAFFPEHYSGKNAGQLALKTAFECHQFFNDHYNTNRTCFDTILMNTGLGIGIDYGESYMANMNGLTLIGKNVVYACRLSATEANTTVLNQSAFEDVSAKNPHLFSFSEVYIDIKGEGSILGYKVQAPQEKLEPAAPDWDKLLEEFKNSSTPTPA